MGKGDKKSRRGKIHIGSYGTRRPRKQSITAVNIVKPVIKEKPMKSEVAAPEKVTKTKAAVEPIAEVAAEVKKVARKSTKKAKEEPAAE